MMKGKEILKDLLHQKAVIDMRKNELQELESLGATALLSIQSCTDGQDAVTDVRSYSEQIKAKSKALRAEIEDYTARKERMIEMISMIKDERYITVIQLKYLYGRTFLDVSYEMGYSEDHAKRLAREALRALDRIIEGQRTAA